MGVPGYRMVFCGHHPLELFRLLFETEGGCGYPFDFLITLFQRCIIILLEAYLAQVEADRTAVIILYRFAFLLLFIELDLVP